MLGVSAVLSLTLLCIQQRQNSTRRFCSRRQRGFPLAATKRVSACDDKEGFAYDDKEGFAYDDKEGFAYDDKGFFAYDA